MKRILALGLVTFALAGCAASPSSPATQEPAPSVTAADPSPEDTSQANLYNPPEPPAFEGGVPAETDEATGLAAQVANAFSAAYEWPTAGPYPEVSGFYGFGSSTATIDVDALIIEVVTTLPATPGVDSPRAIEICQAVTDLWPGIGSPAEWNAIEVRSVDGANMAFCTTHATGP
jgi:hypothetical protein